MRKKKEGVSTFNAYHNWTHHLGDAGRRKRGDYLRRIPKDQRLTFTGADLSVGKRPQASRSTALESTGQSNLSGQQQGGPGRDKTLRRGGKLLQIPGRSKARPARRKSTEEPQPAGSTAVRGGRSTSRSRENRRSKDLMGTLCFFFR